MILKDLKTSLSPLELYRRVAPSSSDSFLLQSADGPRKLARFSMIGLDPHSRVVLDGGRCTIRDGTTSSEPSLAAAVRVLLGRHKPLHPEYRYLGGLVGYFSYEYASALERIPRREPPEGFHDAELGLYLDGVVFDHAEQRVFYFSHGEDRSGQIESRAAKPAPEVARADARDVRRVPDERTFLNNVEAAKHHIREGDIFQAVLSKKIKAGYSGDLLDVYAQLVKLNPSPYMYCLRSGDRWIVGGSPEMLVRVQNGVVETFPIAGTRPMTGTPTDDDRLAAELLADDKERAEHAMLVDLARNDVGRVADFSSVRLRENMRVERYSHVQHLVSLVEGRLRRDLDGMDAFNALFPAGTVSGAPKVRAMEIIHDLEPEARGPYAGAVGYLSFNGAVDSAITLRSLYANGPRVTVQAGAGIVADSVPEREWMETEHKAKILTSILGVRG